VDFHPFHGVALAGATGGSKPGDLLATYAPGLKGNRIMYWAWCIVGMVLETRNLINSQFPHSPAVFYRVIAAAYM